MRERLDCSQDCDVRRLLPDAAQISSARVPVLNNGVRFAGDATLTKLLIGTWQEHRHDTQYRPDGTWIMVRWTKATTRDAGQKEEALEHGDCRSCEVAIVRETCRFKHEDTDFCSRDLDRVQRNGVRKDWRG